VDKILFWTWSVYLVFKQVRQFGGRLCYLHQVKEEKAPRLLDLLQSATLNRWAPQLNSVLLTQRTIHNIYWIYDLIYWCYTFLLPPVRRISAIPIFDSERKFLCLNKNCPSIFLLSCFCLYLLTAGKICFLQSWTALSDNRRICPLCEDAVRVHDT
jgi:hypothetical protein